MIERQKGVSDTLLTFLESQQITIFHKYLKHIDLTMFLYQFFLLHIMHVSLYYLLIMTINAFFLNIVISIKIYIYAIFLI